MEERPALSKTLNAAVFRSYYYLKEELVDFCRREGLQTSGGKPELTERIGLYLSTGEKSASAGRRPKAPVIGEITEGTIIEAPFVCSEKHRAFFKEAIGPGFTFKVAFQKWLKENGGKTYGEAVAAYRRILEEKNPAAIGDQFEYNAYIRAFFAHHTGKSLKDAIACWNYKKSLPGHNRYEKADLAALNQPKD